MATTPTTPTKAPQKTITIVKPAIQYLPSMLGSVKQADIDRVNTFLKSLEEAPEVKPTPTPAVKPPVPKELLIARTPYPKWWRDSLNAKISLSAPGSQVLATVAGNLRLFVATIVITVTGETQISFTFGEAGSGGPIYLGGENQPMGIVIAMGNSPAPCGHGSLSISATDPTAINPSIGGFATVFVEEETT